MGIAVGNSPDEVVAAIGWRRPSGRRGPERRIDAGRALLGPAGIALAALAPLVIVGVSKSLGAVLVVLATALAGSAPAEAVSKAHGFVGLAGSTAVVTSVVLVMQTLPLGVRIGAAVFGLMLAVLMAAVVTDAGSGAEPER